MKQLSFPVTVVVLFFCLSISANAQNQNARQTSTKSDGALRDATNAPYQVPYNDFRIGDTKYANLVLNAWKDYENNTLDKAGDILADTVRAVLPDGTELKGKENFVNAIKAYRAGFASMNIYVAAVVPLYSDSHPDERVVGIWGTETGTRKDGTTEKVRIHETWFFNKDGKLSFFRQFIQQASKK